MSIMKTTFLPIEPQKRIEMLDILWGFALLGILFNNILFFSGYGFLNQEQFSTYKLDHRLYQLLDIVITGKFMTLFSLLFGAGFYIQIKKK